ncbi:hypothetical protein A3K72_04050 [Candidatus Woesearchaeota archaeon RBG_13_36_6]|nr:MAG: hypothetical protein A3K72_04050 [Candidatus Woesearchaeota archaeon RBG_13_36_6]
MERDIKVKRVRTRPQISLLGVFLVLIGLFWLARDMGYIPKWIPIWPFLLILVGLYFILRKPWFEFW